MDSRPTTEEQVKAMLLRRSQEAQAKKDQLWLVALAATEAFLLILLGAYLALVWIPRFLAALEQLGHISVL